MGEGIAGWTKQSGTESLLRGLRLAAVALGIGLVMSAGIARAGDDEEDDDATFEEKIIKNIMTGLGGTNMENRGINYRERSPLVIPPKVVLPPPASDAQALAPNWPKDPDLAKRKAEIAASKKRNYDEREAARPLTPSELARGKTVAAKTTGSDPIQPGVTSTPMLSPSQLGYSGGLGSIFGGGNKVETAPFTGEPDRDSLTQPPVGYQTPSPNYAYGTGPKESLNNEKRIDMMSGKEVGN